MNVAYLVLKTAHNLFGKAPAALDPKELERVEKMAARQYDIEALVLGTEEARGVVVPAATLDAALAEIRARYPDEDEMLADMGGNGLSLEAFKAALERELKVDAVMEKVGSRAAKVSDIEVELYYHYHPEQFQRPETRIARHILVTVNETLAENTREMARMRIAGIAARLAKDPRRFEEQAMKHSECPTALQGGLLGEVPRGKLYPELDAVLFELAESATGEIVESPVGFHLVRCDKIVQAGKMPLAKAKPAIRTMLEERRRSVCQKAWLKQQARQVGN